MKFTVPTTYQEKLNIREVLKLINIFKIRQVHIDNKTYGCIRCLRQNFEYFTISDSGCIIYFQCTACKKQCHVEFNRIDVLEFIDVKHITI